MKIKNAIKAYRAASNAAIAAAVASFAADLSVLYGLVFCSGWDWKNPAESAVVWLVPLLILTFLSLALFKASDALELKAQALEDKRERMRASIRSIAYKATKEREQS